MNLINELPGAREPNGRGAEWVLLHAHVPLGHFVFLSVNSFSFSRPFSYALRSPGVLISR